MVGSLVTGAPSVIADRLKPLATSRTRRRLHKRRIEVDGQEILPNGTPGPETIDTPPGSWDY
jgi:hypothetical protein